jgi:oxygen-independent coproporphyrinogen-3 oxidase
VRWWNAKHPAAYAAKLAAGVSPGVGRELLTTEQRRVEQILLEVRLREGLPLALLRSQGLEAARRYDGEGLLTIDAGRAALTTKGRLLADAVVRDLVD